MVIHANKKDTIANKQPFCFLLCDPGTAIPFSILEETMPGKVDSVSMLAILLSTEIRQHWASRNVLETAASFTCFLVPSFFVIKI